MLRKKVVDAVENDQFHIYPVENVDQGIEILTGIPTGERKPDGSYPEGTINALVKNNLKNMAKKLSEFGKGEGGKSD